MIDTSQWRASIGLWNCHISPILRCGGSSGSDCSLIGLCCLSVLVVLVLLLLLSGDVELNPGPKTGDQSSSRDLLRINSAILAKAITPKLYEITSELYSKELIVQNTKEEMLVMGVQTDSFKAIKLINVLENYLGVSSDPDKYLIDICYVLMHQHHRPLTDICNTILQQLAGQSTVGDEFDGPSNRTQPPLPSPNNSSTIGGNDRSHDMSLVLSTTSTNLSSLPVTHQTTKKPVVTFDTYVCGKDIIETEKYLFTHHGYHSSAIKFTTPLSPILNYFEYNIIDEGEETLMMIGGMAIGVGKDNHPLDVMPGWTCSMGYCAYDRKVYKNGKMKASGPPCTIGDRMGCGIDFNTSPSGYVYVFFTKNGIRFGEPIPMKQPPDGLYSLIRPNSKGDKVLYLGHWKRDLDLIQELTITQEFPTSHQMHSNIPPDVQQYCDIMRDKYKDYQPYISDWPPKLKCGQQYFGRLTLTDSHTTPNRQWSMLRGHTDNVPEGPGKTMEMVDLIKPNESGQSLRAVVDGPPGVGKTTLCRILLNMWATKEHIKHLYDLVLYCPLRNDKIAQAIELKDLFFYRCPEVSIVTKWMEREHGKGVLIIFDGWDELSTQLKKSSLPTSIIQREILDKCSVLVTSRTYATSSLLNLTSHHKHVQVMGFSQEQIKIVIRGTLKPHLAEKLIKDLKVQSDVLSLCYIPLVCSMVIYVYDKLKGQLPTTLTQLYENFLLQTIRRYIQRNVNSYEPEDIFHLDNLPSVIDRDFKELCQFAYLNLKDNNPKITFSSFELQLHMKQSGYLGLINEYGEDGNQFLHLSIQEFLASWWIAKYEKEKTHQEIFNEHFDNDHFKMSLRFIAGLTHLEPNENYQQYFNKQLDLQCKRSPWLGFDDCYHSRLYQNHEIKTLLYHSHIKTDDSNEFAILLFQLLYESQNTKLCSTLALSMKNHSLCLRNMKLSFFDRLCVSYFLNNSNITWNHLDLGRLDEQQVQLLNNTLTINSQYNKCKILEIELEYSTMKLFQLPFFQYIQKCYVKLLDSQCNPFPLLMELLKLYHQLKILHFSSSSLPITLSSSVTSLSIKESSQLIELLNNSILQELVIDLDSDRDYSNEVTSLCNGVALNKTITSFTLLLPYNKSLSDETNQTIIQQLLMNNHTIQALHLRTDHLPSVKIVNTQLTALRLDGSYTSKQLTSFLPHIKGLQCLILPLRSYPSNLIFQSHPSLQQLQILLNTVERAIELFTILQSNVTLKALRVKIISNDDTYNYGDSLCDMLRLNQAIKYLEISKSIPSTSFLSYLTTGLSHNTSLQELSVDIPLSPTNKEQIITFFNVISKMNNITELKVDFTLDQLSAYSNSSIDKKRKQIMTPLYYEHGLPSLTNMIMSHSSIRLLHVITCRYINNDLSRPNWVESVEQLYQSIFIHPSLECIQIKDVSSIKSVSLLKDILQKQNKKLIDKRKQQNLLKPTPTIELW